MTTALVRREERPQMYAFDRSAFWQLVAMGFPTVRIGDTMYIGSISTSTFRRNRP